MLALSKRDLVPPFSSSQRKKLAASMLHKPALPCTKRLKDALQSFRDGLELSHFSLRNDSDTETTDRYRMLAEPRDLTVRSSTSQNGCKEVCLEHSSTYMQDFTTSNARDPALEDTGQDTFDKYLFHENPRITSTGTAMTKPCLHTLCTNATLFGLFKSAMPINFVGECGSCTERTQVLEWHLDTHALHSSSLRGRCSFAYLAHFI